MLGTPPLSLPESGCLRCRFRLHDITKNHQKKLFRVQVAPLLNNRLSSGNSSNSSVGFYPSEIAPDLTASIEVRSKRTKKAKHSHG